MKLELKPFDFNQAVARAGLRPDGMPLAGLGKAAKAGQADAPEGAEPANFTTAMAQALRAVSDAQLESGRLQRELQLDNPTVSLEQTMIAMNKSQVGFQAALNVRNRLVQAYTDIMNMQV
ncbi:MAG: flagellar hook-basal body complex protein FliE [Aquabacterium sp.]|nr:flagellar hook-basal body complex protein FliE [Aquabacterium sp.]